MIEFNKLSRDGRSYVTTTIAGIYYEVPVSTTLSEQEQITVAKKAIFNLRLNESIYTHGRTSFESLPNASNQFISWTI